MLRGLIIAESLRTDVELRVPELRLVGIVRRDLSDSVAPGQPPIWTFIDVEAPSERADALGRALSAALRPELGWYADFVVGDDHVVTFADRTFRYRRGDTAARAEAVAYGRSVGTPEHQLDWDA